MAASIRCCHRKNVDAMGRKNWPRCRAHSEFIIILPDGRYFGLCRAHYLRTKEAGCLNYEQSATYFFTTGEMYPVINMGHVVGTVLAVGRTKANPLSWCKGGHDDYHHKPACFGPGAEV